MKEQLGLRKMAIMTLRARTTVYFLFCGVLAALGAVMTPRAEAGTIYVSATGTNDMASRYNTWGGAATNINDAVAIAAAYDEVVVTNGAYAVITNLFVTNFTVRSVNGPAVTTIYAPVAPTNFPIFLVSNANALVSGFSITNGQTTAGSGGSVEMSAGTVSNCWIINTPYKGNPLNGSIYMRGGLMTCCVISNSNPSAWAIRLDGGVIQDSILTANPGGWINGAVQVTGGTMRRCRVFGQTYGGGTPPAAGGVTFSSGRIENSLIYGNSASSASLPGGVYMTGGAMVNCTIAGNTNSSSAATVGAGILHTGGAITNCVIYGNTGAAGNYTTSGGSIWYSCAPELTLGSQGNVIGNPRFVNLAGNDYHLNFGSVAVNSGTNVGLTDDLDGTSRDALCDMGAFERVPGGGPATVAFHGLPLTGSGSVTSVFTAVLEGGDTNITWWGWDFDNNGAFEQSGGALQVVTNVFEPGRYSVSVRLTNASMETAEWTNLNYVTVQSGGIDAYVSTNGSNTFPYDSWARATTNWADLFGNAVRGGMTVWVSNGAYGLAARINLPTNIAVRSVSGPGATVLYPVVSGTYPIFSLSHTQAYVTGFTLTNAWWSDGDGGSVSMSAGTVSNCWMINSPYRGGSGSRGSVKIAGGLMTSCLISNSQPSAWALYVSGGAIENSTICDNIEYWDTGPVIVAGGTMRRCQVLRNRSNSGNDGGGGVTFNSGRIENSLIAGNYTPKDSKPGGVRQAGGTMVNCTITANSNLVTATVGSGVYRTGGTLTNCVVHGNSEAGGIQYGGGVSAAWYSCAPELTAEVQGNITGDPKFVQPATGDYRLKYGSPCINAGTNWTGGSTAVDLDGLPRLRERIVDMGAYENASQMGTVFSCR